MSSCGRYRLLLRTASIHISTSASVLGRHNTLIRIAVNGLGLGRVSQKSISLCAASGQCLRS